LHEAQHSSHTQSTMMHSSIRRERWSCLLRCAHCMECSGTFCFDVIQNIRVERWSCLLCCVHRMKCSGTFCFRVSQSVIQNICVYLHVESMPPCGASHYHDTTRPMHVCVSWYVCVRTLVYSNGPACAF